MTSGRAPLAGMDVGGTFTHLVLVDEVSGAACVAKVRATVANQTDGAQRVYMGLEQAAGPAFFSRTSVTPRSAPRRWKAATTTRRAWTAGKTARTTGCSAGGTAC